MTHEASTPHDDVEQQIDDIERSGLFDAAHYARVSGAAGDPRQLIRHFLAYGDAELLSPSDDFDVGFYRHTNPDVTPAVTNSLVHFVRFGAAEGRYPNRTRLSRDVAKVVKSGLFDAQLFAGQALPRARGLSDVELYLTTRAQNVPVSRRFDEAFYCGTYDDVARYPGKPLLHYIDVGHRQSRVANAEELHDRKSAAAPHFDAAYYLAQLPADAEKPADPLEHFLLHGVRAGLDPSPHFSLDYYVRRYPDLVGIVDPFYHYCVHGKGEGRVAQLIFSEWFVAGERAFDIGKPTVVVASHEASRTGAPLVGLTLVAELAKRYNVVVSLGKTGPLLNAFVEHSCLYTVGRPSPLDAEYLLKELERAYGVGAIVLNSVETSEYALAALHAGIPSVALLHEFAEYTLPAGRMAAVVEAVDRVIVPAQLLRESLQREVELHAGSPANNVVVRPQGCLPGLPPDEDAADLTREQIFALLRISDPARTRIVLGAGYVQMRKGIDLFVQTAAELRALAGDDVRFVWVGDGYQPTADLAYSAWVADMVRRLDLEQHVFFLPPQASLDILFDAAHVFYLPSRLDPFPNVALDALTAGKAVVCFDRATGFAEVLGAGDTCGAAVGYCNVREAAEALARCMTPQALDAARGNADVARTRYDFAGYAAFVGEQLEVAQALRADLVATARRIAASGTFDTAFHDGCDGVVSEPAAWRSVLGYTARGMKGLLRYNPRPGLNEGAHRCAQADPAERARPALSRAETTGAPRTHRCVLLDDRKPAPPFAGRAALHLHLHYAELAAEFAERLTDAACPADLFITTTSAQKRLEIEYTFRHYALSGVRVVEAPNRGRDVAPLLTTVKRYLRLGGYDVVGHLHGKKSAAVDPAMGERWRRYLTDTLVGSRDDLRRVLALFAADPALGLVFAEDRHCVGWTANKDAAERLAAELEPRPVLPAFPVFPLGTMFWARPAVLEPFWQRDYDAGSFPVEPIPYDGSMLHAFERVLPAVAEATNHSWCTVYRPGSGW